MVDISPESVNTGKRSFVMNRESWLTLAGPRERDLYSNLVAIERLVGSSRVYSSKYEVVYQLSPREDEPCRLTLAIRRTDDGQPVRFASVGIDRATGRCFLKCKAGRHDGAHTEYRSYFVDIHDAARFLISLLSQQSELH
jgi:hypothetical protein